MATKREDKSSDETPAIERIGVTFSRAHRHGGRDYRPGDNLLVTERERAKLAKRGVISG